MDERLKDLLALPAYILPRPTYSFTLPSIDFESYVPRRRSRRRRNKPDKPKKRMTKKEYRYYKRYA